MWARPGVFRSLKFCMLQEGPATNTSLLVSRLDWQVSLVQHLPLPPSWLWHMCLPSPGPTPNQVLEVIRTAFSPIQLFSVALHVLTSMVPPPTILPGGGGSVTRRTSYSKVECSQGTSLITQTKRSHPLPWAIHNLLLQFLLLPP